MYIPIVMLIIRLAFKEFCCILMTSCFSIFRICCFFFKSNAISWAISLETLIRLAWKENEVHGFDNESTMWPRTLTPHITLMLKFSKSNTHITEIVALHHDDVIKWKHFPSNWPFIRTIRRQPGDFPHKGQWRRALVFSLICAGING